MRMQPILWARTPGGEPGHDPVVRHAGRPRGRTARLSPAPAGAAPRRSRRRPAAAAPGPGASRSAIRAALSSSSSASRTAYASGPATPGAVQLEGVVPDLLAGLAQEPLRGQPVQRLQQPGRAAVRAERAPSSASSAATRADEHAVDPLVVAAPPVEQRRVGELVVADHRQQRLRQVVVDVRVDARAARAAAAAGRRARRRPAATAAERRRAGRGRRPALEVQVGERHVPAPRPRPGPRTTPPLDARRRPPAVVRGRCARNSRCGPASAGQRVQPGLHGRQHRRDRRPGGPAAVVIAPPPGCDGGAVTLLSARGRPRVTGSVPGAEPLPRRRPAWARAHRPGRPGARRARAALSLFIAPFLLVAFVLLYGFPGDTGGCSRGPSTRP